MVTDQIKELKVTSNMIDLWIWIIWNDWKKKGLPCYYSVTCKGYLMKFLLDFMI